MSEKRDFSRPRSSFYQYILLEEPVDSGTITEFADLYNAGEVSLTAGQKEELFNLQDRLKEEFWRLVEEELTERQRDVLKMRSVGMTQVAIAKRLNVNQSSIVKSLSGNIDYRLETINGVVIKKKKYYGGAFKKLKRLVSTDNIIQEILQKIEEIQG